MKFSFDGRLIPAFFAEFSVNEIFPNTYQPFNPPGTCKYRYFPDNFTEPFPDLKFPLSGSYELGLPGFRITLDESTNNGPFSHLFPPPDPPSPDGPYTVTLSDDFQVEQLTPRVFFWTGESSRRDGRGLDALFDAGDPTSAETYVDFEQAIDILGNLPLEPGTFIQFDEVADQGPFGRHLRRCFIDPAMFSSTRDALIEQADEIDTFLMRGDPDFLANTEEVTWTVRIIDLNTNKMSQGGPPIDQTKEIFDAVRVSMPSRTLAPLPPVPEFGGYMVLHWFAEFREREQS